MSELRHLNEIWALRKSSMFICFAITIQESLDIYKVAYELIMSIKVR